MGERRTGDRYDPPRWLTGHFLISEADMIDPNFHRTVVLLVNHDREGAFGLIVNKRLEISLSDVLPDFKNEPAGARPLYVGGPVQQQYLFTIHSGFPSSVSSPHAKVPLEQVTFEPDFQSIADYLKVEWASLPEDMRPPVNFYAGYSGWAADQLEAEIERGSWVIRPAAAKHVFADNPDQGWKAALGELGGYYKFIADTDFKPSKN